MKKAGYVTGYGLPIVFHSECGENFEAAILERRGGAGGHVSRQYQPTTLQTKPLNKGFAMGKHFGFDETDYPDQREILKKAYLDVVYDYLKSGEELTPTMAGALAVIIQKKKENE